MTACLSIHFRQKRLSPLLPLNAPPVCDVAVVLVEVFGEGAVGRRSPRHGDLDRGAGAHWPIAADMENGIPIHGGAATLLFELLASSIVFE